MQRILVRSARSSGIARRYASALHPDRLARYSLCVSTRIVLPELDVAKIRRFCEGRVPERVRDQIRIEMEVRGTAVTIVERRPPWRPDYGPEWTRSQVARLRYIQARGVWELYWSDRNGRWHRYDLTAPSARIETILREIKADRTAIFWG